MNNYNLDKEKEEALAAARRALNSLEETRNALQSAKNWGIADMFGGGKFISLIKHSNLDSARAAANRAYRDIRILERELRDVCIDLDLDIEVGALLTALDFFSDNLFMDYLVQRRINEAMNKIDGAIDVIRRIQQRITFNR